MPKRNLKFEIFSSQEEAEQADIRRRAQMTPEERWREMAILQKRAWGENWNKTPIKKIVSYEILNWS